MVQKVVMLSAAIIFPTLCLGSRRFTKATRNKTLVHDGPFSEPARKCYFLTDLCQYIFLQYVLDYMNQILRSWLGIFFVESLKIPVYVYLQPLG